MFKRSGTCNLCGECCGFPRKTDGGQNNAFHPHFHKYTANWTEGAKLETMPILRLIGMKLRGTFWNRPWVWVDGQGLCKDLNAGGEVKFDKRCPFLGDQQEDGTVPCLLYDTAGHFVWAKFCNNVPPEQFENQEQVDRWFEACPSCSFEFEGAK